jgi:hypothetical protein
MKHSKTCPFRTDGKLNVSNDRFTKISNMTALRGLLPKIQFRASKLIIEIKTIA